MKTPIYTLQKEHDTLTFAIFTQVFVSLPPEFTKPETDIATSFMKVKALWDTGATQSAVSD